MVTAKEMMTKTRTDITLALGGCSDNLQSAREPAVRFDAEYDVVIAGSGAGALAAAVTASSHGLSTLVVEKSRYLGGTSAYSSGGLWIPNNHLQSQGVTQAQSMNLGLGFSDSNGAAMTYLRNVLKDSYNAKTIGAYLMQAPKMISWMEQQGYLKFMPTPLPDYRPELVGANVGRTLVCTPFDAKVLGQRVRHLRYPLQGYRAFGSLQSNGFELPALLHPLESWVNFQLVAKKFLRFGVDLIWYGKSAVLYNGNGLIGSLYYHSLQNGCEFWQRSPARGLIVEDGSVTGLVVQREADDRILRIKAKRGVVLATGGFGRKHAYLNQEWTAVPRSNVGDGIDMATSIGGRLPVEPEPHQAVYAPMSVFQPIRGPTRRYPHFADRANPGSIIVDKNGKRFANESQSYQELVRMMHEKGVEKAYLICDRTFLRKYGLGFVLPSPYPFNFMVKWRGYLAKSSSIDGLAREIGLDSRVLQQTVQQMNAFAYSGRDTEYHRGEDAYDKFAGDQQIGPNRCLAPCEKSPFYALAVYPGNVSTTWGLDTDEHARVLSKDGAPILGLYAVGMDQNSVFRGTYPGGGCSLGPALTWGWTAAMHMSAKKQ